MVETGPVKKPVSIMVAASPLLLPIQQENVERKLLRKSLMGVHSLFSGTIQKAIFQKTKIPPIACIPYKSRKYQMIFILDASWKAPSNLCQSFNQKNSCPLTLHFLVRTNCTSHHFKIGELHRGPIFSFLQ